MKNSSYSISGNYSKNIIEGLDEIQESAPINLPIFNFKLGDVGNGSEWPSIAHQDRANPNDFALSQNQDGTTVLNAPIDKSLHFRLGNQDKMVIKNNNIGIGIADPQTKLHVDGIVTAKDFVDSDGILTANQKLCIGETCVDEEQLQYMLNPKVTAPVTAPVAVPVTAPGNIDLGNVHLGPVGHGAAWQGIANKNNVNKTDYALIQHNNGRTLLNSKVGQPLKLKQGNIDKMIIDKNGKTTIDGVHIGDVGHGGAWQGIANKNNVNKTDYALIQHNNGSTILNSKAGQTLQFNQGNVNKMKINSKGNVEIDGIHLGQVGHGAGWQGIANKNNVNKNDYALIQHNNGSTILNSKAGQNLHFRQGNKDKMIIDKNGNTTIDGVHIGDVGHGAGWQGIANKKNVNKTNYALIQNDNGSTILNSKAGQNLHFRQGNVDKMIIDKNGNTTINSKITGKNGMNITGGRSHFKDTENKGRVRVGAAWGIPVLYSEDNQDIIIGVSAKKTAHIGYNNKALSVSGETGDVNIKGKLCIGNTCLTEDNIKNIIFTQAQSKIKVEKYFKKLNLEQVEEFNNAARQLSPPFYMQFRGDQPAPYNKVIYKRLTPVGDWNFFRLLHYDWFSNKKIEGKSITNVMNTDFKLFNNLEDAKANRNPWKFCNYDDAGVGFPRDCGKKSAVGGKWISFYPGKKAKSNKKFEWELVA